MATNVFSDLAGTWLDHDRTRTDAIDLFARRVVHALRPGGAVVDVGCGTGAHLARVHTLARESGKPLSGAVGVELAPGMAAVASTRRGVDAVVGDACSLPFADQSFDVAMSSDVLHLTADPVRAARELCRVTLPGGTVVAALPASSPRGLRRISSGLPARSLLRRYLELPAAYRVAGVVAELERLRCDVRVVRVPDAASGRLLARIARESGRAADLEAVRQLERGGVPETAMVLARVPGPRSGAMPIHVTGLAGWTAARVRDLIGDLPPARGYHVVVRPLRYRTRPHVQAFCEFDRHRITIQVPVPFRPFHEDVAYRAERVGAKGFHFRWHARRLRFERPDELIRYLYLHEYYHWYLREVVGRTGAAAETACDRFALSRL